MVTPVALPGFGYDAGKAEAIADACRTVLKQLPPLDVTVPDQMAAFAQLAAQVMLASKLRTDIRRGAAAIAAYIVAYAASFT